MNIQFDIFKIRTRFSLSFYRKRDTWTTGVLNRTQDGKYCFFLDFDMMKEEYIEGELKHLQEIYDLGDIHLFKSSEKGFHAVSFVKLTAKEYIEILNNSSCDQAFRNLPRFTTYRNWVLRVSEKGRTDKPSYLKTFQSATKRQQSSAHHKFYSLLYEEIKEQLTFPDDITNLTWIEYATGGNV